MKTLFPIAAVLCMVFLSSCCDQLCKCDEKTETFNYDSLANLFFISDSNKTLTRLEMIERVRQKDLEPGDPTKDIQEWNDFLERPENEAVKNLVNVNGFFISYEELLEVLQQTQRNDDRSKGIIIQFGLDEVQEGAAYRKRLKPYVSSGRLNRIINTENYNVVAVTQHGHPAGCPKQCYNPR